MQNTLPGSIHLRGKGLAHGFSNGSLAIIGFIFTPRQNVALLPQKKKKKNSARFLV